MHYSASHGKNGGKLIMIMTVSVLDVSDEIIENGHGTPAMHNNVPAVDTSALSDSSLYGFCSLSKTMSARCRNAVSNPNKAVITIDSVTSEVNISVEYLCFLFRK